MSKSSKRNWARTQLCAYCPAQAETIDHVFARAFFPKDDWSGLPEVPACERCNNDKSKLEHYLATVMLFGSHLANAVSRLEEMGERRLSKNEKLRRKLQSGTSRVWTTTPSGIRVPTTAIPFDNSQFTPLLKYVVKGLALVEFGLRLDGDDFVNVITATDNAGIPLFRDMLARKSAATARRALGNGTVTYEAAQGVDDPRITVWLIELMGGLTFHEDGKEYRTKIGALTGPRRVQERTELRYKWLEGRGDQHATKDTP